MPRRRAKIVATLGPASSSEDVLSRLISAGVDVFRLNFSHGGHDFFRNTVTTIRKLEKKLETHVAILQDLQGPKIRTGPSKNNEAVHVPDQSVWKVTAGNTPTEAGSFSISYRELLKDALVGQIILVDDGKLRFEILEKDKTALKVRALQEGSLSGNKGVHFPNMQLTASSLTEKDFVDLNVGMELDVDFIALSFVRRPQDIRNLRDFLEARHKNCGIIAKIEREEALSTIDEIIAISDGIMVARGDMAIELGPENVPLVQKALIRKCNAAAKPVITATEMLLSMVQNSTPTRAEASDVANAVLDGTDAVMLSNETAVGKYPVEVVKMMDLIVRQAESHTAVEPDKRSPSAPSPMTHATLSEAIVRAAHDISQAIEASTILCVTQKGLAPRLLSKYRPAVPIIAVVRQLALCRRLKCVWGVETLFLNDFPTGMDVIDRLVNETRARGIARSGDHVVITAGLPDLRANSTNTVKVMTIP